MERSEHHPLHSLIGAQNLLTLSETSINVMFSVCSFLFSSSGGVPLTWRLSLLSVRTPGVGARLQQGREQQQHRLLPLVAVSWSQVAVWKLT